MKVHVPVRSTVIAKVPLACLVKPLARPRARVYTKGVYQPLENQRDLLAAVMAFGPLHIDEPVFVDIAINWIGPKKPPPHAIGKQRGDVDNLAKAVNDALVKAKILADDHYIVGQSITKAFGTSDMAYAVIWSVATHTEEVHPCHLHSAPINELPSTPPSQISPQVVFE